jgi:hypothetical protein
VIVPCDALWIAFEQHLKHGEGNPMPSGVVSLVAAVALLASVQTSVNAAVNVAATATVNYVSAVNTAVAANVAVMGAFNNLVAADTAVAIAIATP